MVTHPILPTSVVGSYATPSWLITAIQEMDKGNYGQTDINETFDDAVKVAISDQAQFFDEKTTDKLQNNRKLDSPASSKQRFLSQNTKSK